MLQVKPKIDDQSSCPYCQSELQHKQILWQGMFVCIKSNCEQCHKNLIQDLKVGHANIFNYQLDLDENKVFGNHLAESWLGGRLLKSLKSPQESKVDITKEVFKHTEKALILNCIDFLYGHGLLKLLNAERHLQRDQEYGLVIIVPKFLRWLVPEGVTEVWTVNSPGDIGEAYYLGFDKFIQQEIIRFSEVFVSKAYSHPSKFNISNFTRVNKHDFTVESFRITFIWREDRLWSNSIMSITPFTSKWFQKYKIIQVFSQIRKDFPQAKFTVVGLGKSGVFPKWIEDARLKQFTTDQERIICEIYRESRLVLGVHGSNMLLPSAHAGMTINLLPVDRLGNFAQDILYQIADPRLAAFRYRYLDINTQTTYVSKIAVSMLNRLSGFTDEMTADN